jgi:hypothetical protein
VIADLCALTDQYLYQFNNTSESYPGARNTYSIVCSFRMVVTVSSIEADYVVYILMHLPPD